MLPPGTLKEESLAINKSLLMLRQVRDPTFLLHLQVLIPHSSLHA